MVHLLGCGAIADKSASAPGSGTMPCLPGAEDAVMMACSNRKASRYRVTISVRTYKITKLGDATYLEFIRVRYTTVSLEVLDGTDAVRA